MRKESIAPLGCLIDFVSKKLEDYSILIVGDFNFPDVDWTQIKKSYINVFKMFFNV